MLLYTVVLLATTALAQSSQSVITLSTQKIAASEIPVFTDDLNLNDLETAISRQLVALSVSKPEWKDHDGWAKVSAASCQRISAGLSAARAQFQGLH